MHELIELLQKHAPTLSPLFASISSKQSTSNGDRYICKEEWCHLLHSLSAATPACGLLHPSEKSVKLISDMCRLDITKDPLSMKCLQEEMPVLFNTLRSIKSYPSKLLNPILQCLLNKANAPFQDHLKEDTDIDGSQLSQDTSIIQREHQPEDYLFHFPLLTKCRTRGNYSADKEGRLASCTKKSSKHPTLLPGVFTLFCGHGKSIIIVGFINWKVIITVVLT